MGATALPSGAVLLIALLVAALLAVAVVAWLAWRAARRRGQALAEERARHASTRDEARRMAVLDLAARGLAGARDDEEITRLAGAAATELLGASSTVVVLRASDDLLVSRTASDEGAVADVDDTDVQWLAERALRRGATLRAERRDASEGSPQEGSAAGATALATPLRDAEVLLGALVLRGLPEVSRPSATDVVLAERLAGHVTRAIVRVRQDRAVPQPQPGRSVGAATQGAGDPSAPPARPAHASQPAAADRGAARDDTIDLTDAPAAPDVPAPDVPTPEGAPAPPSGTVVDLATLARSAATDARERAAAEGAPRRVAVLAPPQARLTQPEGALSGLVDAVFSLVLERTEPGSNLAVEVLGLGGGWELVVTHAGEPIEEEALDAAGLPARVSRLGGAIESGEGAGVSRVRVRLPETRAVPAGGPTTSAATDT